jgi:hypothetical protein
VTLPKESQLIKDWFTLAGFDCGGGPEQLFSLINLPPQIVYY